MPREVSASSLACVVVVVRDVVVVIVVVRGGDRAVVVAVVSRGRRPWLWPWSAQPPVRRRCRSTEAPTTTTSSPEASVSHG